jgi:hypothetical protein
MEFYKLIVAGTAGTALMTAFVYVIAMFYDKRLKVVKVLGTMVTNRTTVEKGLSGHAYAIVSGILVHYFVGVLFALLYGLLWQNGIGSPSLTSAILFGFINGVIAICGWRIFIALHPNPPILPLKAYLLCILAGHLFYAIGTVIVFSWVYVSTNPLICSVMNNHDNYML